MSRVQAAALLLPVLLLFQPLPANAKPQVRDCGKGEHSVPDERGKGNLCVSAKEWAKARAICAARTGKGKKINPMNCVCQDGDMVGACGN